MRPRSRWPRLSTRLHLAAATATLVAAVVLPLTGCGGGNATDGDDALPEVQAAAEPTPAVRIVAPDRVKALGTGNLSGPGGQ